MAISLVRVDDRLVHGQVVEGWLPHLKADIVVVVSDEAARDGFQKDLMRLALPDSVHLEVWGVKDAVLGLKRLEQDGGRALVLTPAPQQALGLLEGGVRFSTLNVGGMHYSAGKVQLGRAIFLSDEDRRALKEIASKGVRIEGRAVPDDRGVDLALAIA